MKEKEEQLAEDGSAASKTGGQDDRDVYEPVDIEGQEKTGVWIHQPGAGCPSRRWEPRRGKEAQQGNELQGEVMADFSRCSSSTTEHNDDDRDELAPDKKSGRGKLGKMRKGLKQKMGKLIKSPRKPSKSPEHFESSIPAEIQSPEMDKARGRKDRAMGMLRQVSDSAQNGLRKVLSSKVVKNNTDREKEEATLSEDNSSTMDEALSPTPSTECATTPNVHEPGPIEGAIVDRPPSRKVSFERQDGGV